MTEPNLLTRVDFITVSTKDYDGAAKFYGDVLGLPFSKRWGDMPAGEFETGNLTIAVMQSDGFGLEFRRTRTRSSSTSTTSRARRPSSSHAASSSRGDPRLRRLLPGFFHDPDGNALAIHHRYAPQETSA